MQHSRFDVRKRIFTVIFAFGAATAAQQAPAGTSMAEYAVELAAPTYLTIDEMPDPMQFLPPPPTWTSPLFAGDYAAYLWGKTVRPTERGKKAIVQAAYLFDEISRFFSEPFGLEISREKTPAIYKVLYKGVTTAMHSYVRTKKTYARLRPFVRYNESTPFPEDEATLRNNGSYPSGHTVRGWCLGLLASEINPAGQNGLLKLGYEWGESRIIIGYHWKSDVEAARALASAVYSRLHTSEDFLSDMAAARREFAKLTEKPKASGSGVKMLRTESAAVQNAKRNAVASLKKLGPTITDFEIRRKKNIPGKRAAFYIDDVIWIFRELAERKPKSCWDHRFLGHLKEAHEKYGLKVQLNVFYRDDFYYGAKTAAFTLKDMPDTWRAEFQAAKPWLRFGFHSLQEFPDYPWINASYDDVKYTWDLTAAEVERFAGPGMFALAVTPHWGPMSKEGCIALKDCGAKLVWVSRGDRWEYNGDKSLLPYGHAMRIEQFRKPETAVYWRTGGGDDISVSACGYNHLMAEEVKKTRGTYNWVHDRSTGVNFKAFSLGGTCLNLLNLEDVTKALDANGRPELYIYATHEEYYYRHYALFQPDYCEKTLIAAKWMHDNGYEYCFIEDSAD